MDEKDISWGTHTIPQWDPSIPAKERNLANSFWTSGKPPLRKDESFLARKRAKKARYERNRVARADENKARNARAGKR